MYKVATLWFGFAIWPIGAVCLLGVAEIGRVKAGDSQTWINALLMKAGLALVGYGLGSVVPYLLSDEYLYLKFATISGSATNYSITFKSIEREKFNFAKVCVTLLFVVGLVVWFANLFLPDVLGTLPFPKLSQWFWASGFIYWLLASGLYVYIRTGRNELVVPTGAA